MKRTKDVGVITGEEAVALGLTGPSLRASGVPFDIRKDEPYEVYSELDWEIATATKGDTYARYLCRLKEMRESLKMVEQCMDGMPEGDWIAKAPKTLKLPLVWL